MTHAELNRARAIDIETAELSQWKSALPTHTACSICRWKTSARRFLISGTF